MMIYEISSSIKKMIPRAKYPIKLINRPTIRTCSQSSSKVKTPQPSGYPSRKPQLRPNKEPKSMTVRKVFEAAFGKYLLLTNTVSSGVLMLVGDLVQQEVEYQQGVLKERYNYGRLWRMTFVGVSQGPLHHYYYSWLSKVLPGRTLVAITQKILLDQLVVSPICIPEFFYMNSLLELKSFEEATNEIKAKFWEVYKMDWIVWPPAQFVNFYFIRVRFQVLYINSVTTLYNVFLSYVKHRRPTEEVNEPPSVKA